MTTEKTEYPENLDITIGVSLGDELGCGWDAAWQLDADTLIAFDYWREDWEADCENPNPHHDKLRKRRGLDRALIASKGKWVAEIYGTNLSIRDDNVDVLEYRGD